MVVFAYDHALRQQLATPSPTVYIGAPVTVGAFLESLIGCKALLAFHKQKCGALLDSFMAVLQTAQSYIPVAREGLLAFFERRCAIVCRRGQAAIDFIVPVVLSGPRDKDARTLAASDMTETFIEVKNWQASELSPARIKKISADMDGVVRDPFPVRNDIDLCQQKATKGKVHTISSPQDGRLRMVISGVSHQRSSCLSASMAKSPRAIAHRPSEEEEVFNANLEAEWGLSPEEVRRASRESMLPAFGAGKNKRRPAARLHSAKTQSAKAARTSKLVKCSALLAQGLWRDGHSCKAIVQNISKLAVWVQQRLPLAGRAPL